MPHQCVHCGNLYPDAAEQLLKGCSCGSHFFYYIKKEYYDQLKKAPKNIEELESEILGEENEGKEEKSEEKSGILEIVQKIKAVDKTDKKKMERDVREMIGIAEQEEIPVILYLESIKVLSPGKFEIDIVNLFNKRRPLIYKLEEGKYIIDLASTLKINAEDMERDFKKAH